MYEPSQDTDLKMTTKFFTVKEEELKIINYC